MAGWRLVAAWLILAAGVLLGVCRRLIERLDKQTRAAGTPLPTRKSWWCAVCSTRLPLPRSACLHKCKAGSGRAAVCCGARHLTRSAPRLAAAAAQVAAQGPAAAPASAADADGSGLPPVPAQRPSFFLGMATAAPQIEVCPCAVHRTGCSEKRCAASHSRHTGPCSKQGAVAEDGRSPSIWDTWAAAHPASDSPNVTDDFYHQWAGDIAIIQRYGIKHFRFSVAWTRVMPDGNGSVNAAGMAFYSRVVDALLAAGIEPVVTLYHWDLPQARRPAAQWPPRLHMHALGTGRGRHAHGPLTCMHAEPANACAA